MRQLNQAGVKWISRVSETLTAAKTLLEEGCPDWQHSEDGRIYWFSRQMSLPQGEERWVVVYTQASVERVRQTMQRQVSKAQVKWEQTCWHFSKRRFACEADARAAVERELKGKPSWLKVRSSFLAHPRYADKGRPPKEGQPTSYQWQVELTLSVNWLQVVQEVLHKACWIVGTNIVDAADLSDQELIGTYKDQGAVERGFRFLKDPLFLASSVFVKKPQRIMALSFIMVLCLLVYRLAEFRLRERLAQTQHTIPDQLHKPTARPTMRLSSFTVFCGIELLHVQTAATPLVLVLRLQPVHDLILQLLGPLYEKIYHPSS
jgi:transposase